MCMTSDVFNNKLLLLFDGYCNLCSGSVVFILKREKKDWFRFASLQSSFARSLLEKYGLTKDAPDSIVLFEGDKIYFQSTAALRAARKLRWPWPVFYVFIILPRFIRDPIYNFIARNRYKWFGRKEQCFVPDRGVKHKFLD